MIWIAKNVHMWDNRSFLQRMHLNITWASSTEGDWFFWQLLSSSLPLGELASWRHRHLFLAHSGKQELEEGGDLFCTFGINLQNTGQQCFFLELLVHFKDDREDSRPLSGTKRQILLVYLKLVRAEEVYPSGGGSQSPETWPPFKWKCICAFISVHWQPVLNDCSPPTG